VKWILGIDTSAYTASAAAVDSEGRLLAEERLVLRVPGGSRGLRQSEAVFQHVQNLPQVLETLLARLPGGLSGNEKLAAVCVSSRPRPWEDSYMPVFMCGVAVARSLAALSRSNLFLTSHQEGHLRAGIFSAGSWREPCALGLEREFAGLEKAGLNEAGSFIAVHLSGGTSEILDVERFPGGFKTKILGRTLDLHAGQFVDRVGVAMGLPFPAGPALEELARQSNEDFPRLPAAVKGMDFSFSGSETRLQRLIAAGETYPRIARAAEALVSRTLAKALRRALEATGKREILVVGGVAANQYLRQFLSKKLEHPAVGARLYFAAPSLSADNAVGVALLGWEKWRELKQQGEQLFC